MKEASDRTVLIVTRITLLVIAAFAMLIALDENSVIFKIVFAWAGFGDFWPDHALFSFGSSNLGWAVAGMVTVGVWSSSGILLEPLGGIWHL